MPLSLVSICLHLSLLKKSVSLLLSQFSNCLSASHNFQTVCLPFSHNFQCLSPSLLIFNLSSCLSLCPFLSLYLPSLSVSFSAPPSLSPSLFLLSPQSVCVSHCWSFCLSHSVCLYLPSPSPTVCLSLSLLVSVSQSVSLDSVSDLPFPHSPDSLHYISTDAEFLGC